MASTSQKGSAISVISPRSAAVFCQILPPGQQLYTLLYFLAEICLFYTEKQLSVHRFTQFRKVTKISIAFAAPFVYNVTIRVSAP